MSTITRSLAAALLAVALPMGAASQTPASPKPQPATPPRPALGPAKPFRPAARAERTLPNGLLVVAARHTSVPKVSVTLSVKSGLAADPKDLPGIAGFVAEAIQEGTKARSSQQIRQQAFGMGASLSAAASQDYTSITTRGLVEYVPGLLDLVADVAMTPTFPDEELNIIRQNMLLNLQRQVTSPQFVSQRQFREALFGPHQYARITSTPESVKAIDRAKLVAFHETYYRPNNAVLLVVGDIATEAVFGAAEKAFGAWTKKDVPAVGFPPLPKVEGRRVLFVQRPNSVQSSIRVGNFAIRRSSPDWYAYTIANTIYGGAFNSRIVRNIREEKGYTYSPSSQFTAFLDAGFYMFGADVRNEVTGATLKEVFLEIDKLRNDGAQGAELEAAKQYYKGIYVLQNATQAGLAAALNSQYMFGLPKDYLESFQSKIEAVGPAQVKAGAQGLVGSDQSVIVIVGDYTKVKDQLAEYKSIEFYDVSGTRMSAAPIQ